MPLPLKCDGNGRRIWWVLWALVGLPLNAFSQAPDRPIPPPVHKDWADQIKPQEYLVGVDYFAGWWPESPNKYVIKDHDWRPDYPERAPLLGFYNTQSCMDYETRIAAGYGVDFFQFLWYPPEPGARDAQGKLVVFSSEAQRLNDGLRYYLGSPHRSILRFSLEYVNHPPFNISDRDWPKACQFWANCMRESTYLRIGRRPLFKIHGLELFYGQCGNNMSKMADRIAQIRDAANQAGVGLPLIGAGVTRGDKIEASVAEPFDWVSSYMDVPPLKTQADPYPYTQLMDFAADSWPKLANKYKKPYAPYVPAGWDPRPWQDRRPSFAAPKREEWRAALDRTKTVLDGNSDLALPTGQPNSQKVLFIYAWNEFGEGGIVAPTRGDQYMKLEVIREVFGQIATTR